MIASAQARPAQRRVAETAIAAATERVSPSASARVDLVDDDYGRPQLLELEVVEPSAFLDTAAGLAQASLAPLPGASILRPERVEIESDSGRSSLDDGHQSGKAGEGCEHHDDQAEDTTHAAWLD